MDAFEFSDHEIDDALDGELDPAAVEFVAGLRAAHAAVLADIARHTDIEGDLRAFKLYAARRPRVRRWRRSWH